MTMKKVGFLVVVGMLHGGIVSAGLLVVPVNTSKSSCSSCPPEVVVPVSGSIQQAIDSLPTEGGTIFIKAGVHEITQEIHINRSNVSITGEQGAIIKLKNGANTPVILIGTDVVSPGPADLISNISVANLEIDGNQAGQTSETDPARPHIRNNGIDVRSVSHLRIGDVKIHDARSGGIVVSWKSSDIVISGSNTYDNYYDEIALYDSEDIVVTDFISNSNDHGAGLSLDNSLKQVVFSNGIIRDNFDVGIFARNSNGMTFSNLIVRANGKHGAFLSHDDTNPAITGVTNILVTGCSFLNNNGYGIQLASPSTYSNKNAVTGTLFNGNTSGCLQLEAGSMSEAGNVCL